MKNPLKASWKRPATWFRWHRWLGYLIGIQLLIWIIGGLIFAIVPFQTMVKGKDLVSKPSLQLPEQWQLNFSKLTTEHGALQGLQSIASAHGFALRLQFKDKNLITDLHGTPLPKPSQDQIQTFAQQLYRGHGNLEAVRLLSAVPRQLAIVKELGTRTNIWLAQFKDSQNTRLYFDANTGEYITVRTDAWVWYDFFWRLHVMDYSEGEDFNNTLLRIASMLALLMMLTGVVLSVRNLLRKRF
ncbi:PepSY domain-containing protein [Undibacterium fentianense]|uniref:PepSY domain-containing protein n=1 Tax=Undibacterium fentianense TaxID=2828728 RepID=A0A941E6D1_9BURK|nr:PepSY domain-containing protein [Undibacterium fentianense]MBR7801389.1 PepSY domain-containing protein [Undibacterium fentianense]